MTNIKTIIIGMIAAIVLLIMLDVYFSFPFVINLMICSIILFCLIYFSSFFYYNWTKNSKKIEKIMMKKTKHPYYSFIFAISNNDDQQIIVSYRKMLKNKKYYRLYPLITIIFSMYFNNTLGVEEEIKKLKQPALQTYYQTLLLLSRKELEQAEKLINNMKIKWMKEVLLTEWNLKKEDNINAKKHSLLAIKHARGLTLYLLLKKYDELFS